MDAFERVARFRVLSWSLVGAFLGLLLGIFLWVQGRPVWIIAVTVLVGWAITFFGPLLILRGAGRAGSVLYTPSGRTTPRKREYSLAESYVARGEHQAAVDAFEEAVLEDPTDPRPYLRIARIYRDELADPEAAARWFKRALAEAETPAGVALLARKELVELYRVRMGESRRAAPILARIAEEAADTPDGAWAAAELARIKTEMAGGPDTP